MADKPEGAPPPAILGALCLLAALIALLAAPVLGGLSGMSDSPSNMEFAPDDPVPLAAHRAVVVESANYGTELADCTVTGPGGFDDWVGYEYDDFTFHTKAAGNYHISCKGGNVSVQNDASGNPAAAVQQQKGNGLTFGLRVAAGVLAVAGVGLLGFAAVLTSRATKQTLAEREAGEEAAGASDDSH